MSSRPPRVSGGCARAAKRRAEEGERPQGESLLVLRSLVRQHARRVAGPVLARARRRDLPVSRAPTHAYGVAGARNRHPAPQLLGEASQLHRRAAVRLACALRPRCSAASSRRCRPPPLERCAVAALWFALLALPRPD